MMRVLRALLGATAVAFALVVSAASATWASPGYIYTVLWAPSQQIVFVASGGAVYVISPAGGQPRLLTRADGDMLSIRRDGAVLYTKNHSLVTIPVAGGRPRILGVGADGVWSPDGTRIATVESGWVTVENAGTGGKRRLARNRYPELTGFPTWSPDGRKLAYVACRAPYLSSGCEHATAFDVYVIGVDGSDKHRITPNPGLPGCPAWSSTGKLAYYDTVNLVVAVVRNGGVVRTLRPGDCPIWEPNGRRLAVATATGAELMNFDGSNRKQIIVAPHAYGSRALAWSPDGKWLTIVDGADHPHLWVIRANGTRRKRLL